MDERAVMTFDTDRSVPSELAASAHRHSVDEVAAAVAADPRNGLTGADAAARLARDGPNELTAEPPVPAWRRFLAQFQDVLVILLLIATAVSAGL